MPITVAHLDAGWVLATNGFFPSDPTTLVSKTSMNVEETMNGNIVVTMINAGMPVVPRVRKRKIPTMIVALN